MSSAARFASLVGLWGSLGALGASAGVAACGSSETSPGSMHDASIDASSPADGGADVVQPPAGCDPAADPKDAPKCVVSEFGVFGNPMARWRVA